MVRRLWHVTIASGRAPACESCDAAGTAGTSSGKSGPARSVSGAHELTCSDAKSCRSFGHQNREAAQNRRGEKRRGRRRRRSTPEALNLGLRGGSAPLAPPARAQVKCASGEVPPHLNRATNASAASERDLPILRYSLALLWGKKQVPWKEPQILTYSEIQFATLAQAPWPR